MNDLASITQIEGRFNRSRAFSHLTHLITAVLPTYNRPQYLERALLHYRNCPFKVIVLDSSDAPYEGMLPRNFVYHYRPNWPFCQKTPFGFSLVETPYAISINDDDFFFYSAIEREVAFLEANPSYASAQGFYMTKPPDTVSKVMALLYAHRPAFRIDADDPGHRLLQLKQTYMHTSYSVHRTANMKQIMERGRFFLSPFCMEFLISLGSVAMGKHIMLPYLHSVRDTTPDSGGRDPHGFYGLRLLPSRMRELSYSFYALQTVLRDVMGIDNDTAYAMVDRITPDPIEPRTIAERTAPPLGPHPQDVPELSRAEWSRLTACASNPRLLEIDRKLRTFVAEVEDYRKTAGAKLPVACSDLQLV